MPPGARSTHDKEMASRLKREGDERTVARCPLCYNIVGLPGFQTHVGMTCKGRRVTIAPRSRR